MTNKNTFTNRLLSIFLCLALLISYIPASAFLANAVDSMDTRVADPSTMNNWKDFFLPSDGTLSTENAGGVWTNKSVFTSTADFAHTQIAMQQSDAFLVALSAIATNKTVTGMSSLPADTMLVLDVSGSMSDNGTQLVSAANQTIQALMDMNKYARVGVVVYSGTRNSDTNNDAAVVLLPLGRYDTTSYSGYGQNRTPSYLSHNNGAVRVNSGVTLEGTTTRPSTANVSKSITGATYIQKGIIEAMNVFTATSNSTTIEDPALGTIQRMPVVVLMSDGAPTLGSTNFSAPGQFNLGNGSNTSTVLGFVTQLSAAYAKQQIEKKYGTDCLFYTLGLGLGNDSVANSVVNPAATTNDITTYWTRYKEAAVGDQVVVEYDDNDEPVEWVVKLALENGKELTNDYVDRYFSSSQASNLAATFESIVSQISLQSKYFPTLIADSEDLSGYVSFVDKIGQYMEVTDVKGVLINDVLYSGADLAKNFAANADGGDLGTVEKPTALGDELVWAVMARLGLATADEARTIIGLAYQYGQLSYTDANNFSNYIGWYANADGKFLGFWHEGITTMSDPNDPNLTAATRPAFIMKSYGYLGAVDAEHGVEASDMMYATVQVRESITTGEQTVIFAVPAALIPVLTYNVTLDENGTLTDLTATGAEHPIRLVYAVGLDPDINEFTVQDIVSADYLAKNTDANGNIHFYASQYDVNNVGYGTVNTYSYFNPSRQNDRYYYLENAMVYADQNGTPYTQTSQPSGDKYRCQVVYVKQGNSLTTQKLYHKLSQEAMDSAQWNATEGHWYIPQGNIRADFEYYSRYKGNQATEDPAQNLTGTLPWCNKPYVDFSGHGVGDTGYDYYVGAILGNNGKMSVTPGTGIKLSKEMAAGVAAPAAGFQFQLTNTTNTADNTLYNARLVDADGNAQTTTVQFNAGKATVTLTAGQSLYITGMTSGDVITITETETADYKVQSVNGKNEASASVTVTDNVFAAAAFVNAVRGKGNLTISKEVEHLFGTSYQIPAGLAFEMTVTLSGVGTANATFEAKKTGDTALTSITTDANGQFKVTLEDNQQLEIFNLPDGTQATVVETNILTGFTPAYWDNGQAGDGQVTVVADNTVSVIVVNRYAAQEVYPVYITVTGEKILEGRDWKDTDEFTFRLERQTGPDTWQVLATTSVKGTDADKTFDFNGAFELERYTEAGSYYYRVVEEEPATPIGGISYDKTVHSFSVHVGDADMDGQLEITEVVSQRPGTTVVTKPDADSWNVDVSFTNTYSTTGQAVVTIDLNKLVENPSDSPLATSAGFQFALYKEGQTDPVFVSPLTTDRGFARMVLTFTGEGKHEFILQEKVDDPQENWTYSTEKIPVTIEVSDDGNGGLKAVIYIGQNATGATNSISVSFTNRYVPKQAELPIDFVSKQLSGRDLVAGEFDFEVQDITNVTILTGTNDAAGKVTFNDSLKFDKVGVYYYNIVETSADGKGVTSDKTTYRVTVTVSDVAGQLTASYVLVNVEGDQVVFHNTYTTSSVGYSISGNKTLKGRALLNDEFTFLLTEALDAAGNLATNAASWEAKNYIDGSFKFPQITYTQAGTYYYLVSEQTNGGADYGIRYDSTKYVVTVVVTDDLEGTLVVSNVSFAIQGNGVVNSLTFVNEYIPNPTSTEIPGNKVLEGKVLGVGDYSFNLYESDANWTQPANPVQTVKNSADGTFRFPAIQFTKAGTYYYLVSEVDGGKTIDGVTYDHTVFRVKVVITDDLRGQLHAAIEVFDQNNLPHNSVTFVNRYQIEGTESVTIEGNKTLTGRDMTDGEFEFELYPADRHFTPTGEAPQTVKNASNKFSFQLHYNAQDVNQNFYYVLKEKNGGQTIGGVTFSSEVYYITVSVSDDGMGGIKTLTTLETETATVQSIEFINAYVAEKTSVTFTGEKVLEGIRNLAADEFSFEIYSADSSFAPQGAALQTVKNLADGSFAFAPIDLTEAKTYYFLIKENSQNPLAGITYDPGVYQISVTVTDDLEGHLVAAEPVITYVNETAQAATEIVFTNSYVPGSVNVSLTGTKLLSGRPMVENEFVFELVETDASFAPLAGAQVMQAFNKADGSFAFDALTFTEIGTYYYIVTENGQAAELGMTYDGAVYQITVVISDDGQGQLLKDVTIQSGGQDATILFSNSFRAPDTKLDISGTKIYNGKPLTAGLFRFELQQANSSFLPMEGQTPMVVENLADGTFTFAGLTYSSAGDYYYVITESQANPIAGVEYDTAVYHVTVTVSDASGQLEAKVSSILRVEGTATESAQEIRFVNSYVPGSVQLKLEGEKVLSGRPLKDMEFTFRLWQTNSAFFHEDMEPIQETTNRPDGTFVFRDVSFAEAGIHYLVIDESGLYPVLGVRYDLSRYHITVDVRDDGRGNLYIHSVQMNRVIADVSRKATDIIFENEYSALPTQLVLEGNKTLTGRDLAAEEFSFQLMQADAGFVVDTSIAARVAKNRADGSFAFEAIQFSKAGTYYFVAREMAGSIPGVSYDLSEYRITVTVLDNNRGELYIGDVTMVCVLGADEIPAEVLHFENVYRASDVTTSVAGNKVLTGRELKEGEFEFLMQEANENFQPIAAAPIRKVLNQADGSFLFEGLTFQKAGTYYFVVTEDTAIHADRVTFDESIFCVTIQVTDNGQGKLVASEPVITKGGEAQTAIVFTNVYVPKPADLPLSFVIDKTVVNKGQESIGPEDFVFQMISNVDDKPIIIRTDAEGKAKFELLYTEEDIGKTYIYTVSEQNDGRNYVTYSQAVYTVAVTISLNENNELVAAMTVNEAAAEQVKLSFVNEYDYTPPKEEGSPGTGDTGLGLWIALLFVSGGCMMVTAMAAKKKEEEKI